MLRPVLDEMQQRVRGAVAGFGDVAERPPRKTGSRLERVADTFEGKDRHEQDVDDGPPGGAPPLPGSGGRDPALVVADELHRIHLSGVQAMWTNFLPRFLPQRKFEQWITAKIEGPLPRLGPESAFNCRELIMWAAAEKGVLTHAQLREQYASLLGRKAQRNRQQGFLPPNFPYLMRDATLPRGSQDLEMSDPDGLRPGRGDLIVWDGWGEGNAHTAMATGRLIGPQRDPELYSFWPPPTGLDIPGTVTDAVQITTVSELTPFVDGPDSPALPIWFGRGPW